MNTSQRTLKEVGEQARATYDRLIKAKVEPMNQGKIINFEISNGDYELSEDKDDSAAFDKLRARNPNGQFYSRRVGEPSWVDRILWPFKEIRE